MRWLALVFPDWPLQALFRNPAHTRPLAMAHRQRVCALDATALAQGVRPGQGVADALAIAPDLLARPKSPEAERSALREAAGCALRYTPRVVLEDDGLLLDIAGSTRLFGGLDALLRHLRSDLAAAGFRALSACAPTPRAARWLARATPGQCVADDDHALAEALAALPLRAMEADASLLALLADSGLRTVGEVMKLPRDALARRDAAGLRRLLDQALGQRPDPRPFFEAPPQIDSRLELPVPRHDSDVLLFAANRLFNACCTQLAAVHAGIESCRLELEHEHHPPTVLTLTLGTPSRDAHRMALLTREHLARLALPEAVGALRLKAAHWIELAGRSEDLFGPQAPSPARRQEAGRLLIEHLRARLGPDRVYALSACADHRPERSQQQVEPGPGTTAAAQGGRRPLWLLPEPPVAADPPQPAVARRTARTGQRPRTHRVRLVGHRWGSQSGRCAARLFRRPEHRSRSVVDLPRAPAAHTAGTCTGCSREVASAWMTDIASAHEYPRIIEIHLRPAGLRDLDRGTTGAAEAAPAG